MENNDVINFGTQINDKDKNPKINFGQMEEINEYELPSINDSKYNTTYQNNDYNHINCLNDANITQQFKNNSMKINVNGFFNLDFDYIH